MHKPLSEARPRLQAAVPPRSAARTPQSERAAPRRLGRIGMLGAVGLTCLATAAPGALASAASASAASSGARVAARAAAPLDAAGPAAAVPRAALPTAAVSMGDSFISGEAGRWQGNGVPVLTTGDVRGTDRAAYDCTLGYTWCGHDPARVYGASSANGCDRSDVAEIRSARLPVDQRVNLACSGAVTANVLPAKDGGQSFKGEAPQTDQLAALARRVDVKLIVVSISGNDLNFSGVLAHCFGDYTAGLGACASTQQPKLAAALITVEPKVEQVLEDIRAAMSSDGYQNSDYRLVLQSYPSPFPDGDHLRYKDKTSRLAIGGCPIYNSDATWARDTVVAEIAAMLKKAASAQGAEFLDLQGATAGHELCANTDMQATGANTLANPLPAAKAEWIRFLTTGLTQGTLQESIHPNAYAQHALGTCLTLLWAQTPGKYACSGAAHQGTGDMRLVAES